jgi:hypothetical protein
VFPAKSNLKPLFGHLSERTRVVPNSKVGTTLFEMVWNKLFGRHSSSIKSSGLDKRFYDFAVNSAEGTPLDLNQLKDKVELK